MKGLGVGWLRRLVRRYRWWRLMRYDCGPCGEMGLTCEDARFWHEGAKRYHCPKGEALHGRGPRGERARQAAGL